jgi:hypothetical protein
VGLSGVRTGGLVPAAMISCKCPRQEVHVKINGARFRLGPGTTRTAACMDHSTTRRSLVPSLLGLYPTSPLKTLLGLYLIKPSVTLLQEEERKSLVQIRPDSLKIQPGPRIANASPSKGVPPVGETPPPAESSRRLLPIPTRSDSDRNLPSRRPPSRQLAPLREAAARVEYGERWGGEPWSTRARWWARRWWGWAGRGCGS